MQLYALNLKNEWIHARKATKHYNYSCVECKQIVRLRGGPHRQPHFYHPDPSPYCRQHQKGVIHLHLQAYFFNLLPFNECKLEYHFPLINRIADVAWLSEKIIFEIQYSPISAEEILQRNHDYSTLGWTVVWILHDHRFNQSRISAAEIALRSSPHYFSNMDLNAQGIIYDQWDEIAGGLRKSKSSRLPVNIKRFKTLDSEHLTFRFNQKLRNRLPWKLSFEGDLIHLYEKDPESFFFKDLETNDRNKKTTQSFKVIFLFHYIVRFYSSFLKYMLEKACR